MLAAGSRLGVYEIIGAIGAGGMGEVYRARDTRLKRDVALKILPESFAGDADRLARFQREAEILASLNHPNIAAVYGVEESEGTRALVMELVEGETLADRIARGPIPVAEARVVAKHIAEALETAHGQGIVHRDLKPANVKLRPDGAVKVLDFGLAKLADTVTDTAPASVMLSNSPTVTSPVSLTRVGVLLGTAAYMSPEQACGKAVDHRSDIWAFGCVLYEMLSGRPAFSGDDVTQVLARIIEREPDLAALPLTVSSPLRTLLQRCLTKNPRRRLAHITDAWLELDDEDSRSADVVGIGHNRRRTVGFAATTVIGVALIGSSIWFAAGRAPVSDGALVVIPSVDVALTPQGGDHSVAIAPDGSHIAYFRVRGAERQLLVRDLGELEPRVVASGPFLRGPFFSPDSQWVGFAEGNELRKARTSGGPQIPIVSVDGATFRGAAWTADDTIVFTPNQSAVGLWRVRASGGSPSQLTRPDASRGETSHRWPQLLPDGHSILFSIVRRRERDDTAEVAVLDLRTGARKIVLQGGGDARYVRSGHLLYGAGGVLNVVAFDLTRLETVGSPSPMVDQVLSNVSRTTGDFDVSDDGTLIYVRGNFPAQQQRTLVWVDRAGREEPLTAPARSYYYPRLSPDGTRIAVNIQDQQVDLWIWDVIRETLTRFTFDRGQDTYPVWTTDSRRLVFSSESAGIANLFVQAADGTGDVERLTNSTNRQFPVAISPDNTRIAYFEDARSRDLMTVALGGDHKTLPIVQSRFIEQNAEISPDGRWLAYESNDSGRFEVYVRPFPDTDRGRWQISTAGGTQPMWGRNTQELFYVAPGNQLLSVSFERGDKWAAGSPAKVIAGPYFGAGNTGRTYDVSPDGGRFLVTKVVPGPDEASTPPQLVIVQNLFPELRRLAPGK